MNYKMYINHNGNSYETRYNEDVATIVVPELDRMLKVDRDELLDIMLNYLYGRVKRGELTKVPEITLAISLNFDNEVIAEHETQNAFVTEGQEDDLKEE